MSVSRRALGLERVRTTMPIWTSWCRSAACFLVALSLFTPPAALAQVLDRTEVQKLVPDVPQNGDQFGHAVDVSGNTMVIGTRFGEVAYIFERDAQNRWVQVHDFRLAEARDLGKSSCRRWEHCCRRCQQS